jgi:hypothetical protein
MTSTSELGRELQKQHGLTVGCLVFASNFYNVSTRTVAFLVFLTFNKYSLIAVVSDLSQEQ